MTDDVARAEPSEPEFASGFDGLARAHPSLPASWYRDAAQHAREIDAIWRRGWLCAGRASDLDGPLAYVAMRLAGEPVLLLRDEVCRLRAFLNVCRHRGAELVPEGVGRLANARIVCPYHAWSYRASGALMATGHARPVAGFERAEHGLIALAVVERAGFVFVRLSGEADFDALHGPALGLLGAWPLDGLIVGHRWEAALACDWKLFWENFNECLHCPGVHPALSERVPIYGRGIMAPRDDPNWAAQAGSDDPRLTGRLARGAVSWTPDGAACGPIFPGLGDAERAAGQTYAVVMPGLFVVGHVDYVRAVRVLPDGPGRMRLIADWLFAPETLAQPGFDAAAVAAFAIGVLEEDGRACELNQRGLAARGFEHGVLMQEEYEIAAFHAWLRARLAEV